MAWKSLAPFCVALLCLVAIVAIVPTATSGSHPKRPSQNRHENQDQPLMNDTDTADGSDTENQHSVQQTVTKKEYRTLFGYNLSFGKVAAAFQPFDNSGAHFCLATFFFKKIAFASEGFMFQYTSEKFGWELRQTTWLRVVSAIGAVFVTLVAGPLMNQWAYRHGVQGRTASLSTVQVSLVVLVFSFAGAWASPSGTIFLIGA